MEMLALPIRQEGASFALQHVELAAVMSRAGSESNCSTGESRLYFAIFLALALVYLLSGLVLPALNGGGERTRETLFGFSQFGCFEVPCVLIGLLIPGAVLLVRWALSPGSIDRISGLSVRIFRNTWFRVGFSLLLVTIFFLLRNQFINYDGQMLAEKFARDIPLHGSHVTHDEMWELYLHSRFWFYTNHLFGWSVEFSYQVLSSVVGGAFILLLMYYCSFMFPDRPVLAFALCVSGGYMQLFFGDVENYTMTATLIMAYFVVSSRYIKGRTNIIVPSVVLASAFTFHLLAGFLIPSLLVLFNIARKRNEKRSLIIAAGMFCSIVGLTLLFFHLHDLPIRNLWFHSHAFGHGGNIRPRLVEPSPGYYFQMLNLAFLLVPVWIILIPQLIFGRIKLDYMNMHLIVAVIFMGLFFLGWKATLGVHADWNMFAAAALPVTFLVLRNMFSTECIRRRYWLIYLFTWLFLLHSYSWVISNHFCHASSG